MDNAVAHKAEVTGVCGDNLTLRMLADASSCAGCALARICGAEGGKDELTIKCDNAAEFAAGDTVSLTASAATDRLAWTVMIIAPCALLVAVIYVMMRIYDSQMVAAAGALAVVAVWFAVLYLLRFRLSAMVRWTVKLSDK